MKKITLLLVIFIGFSSCKDEKKETNDSATEIVEKEVSTTDDYQSFGKKINKDDALSAIRMMEHYKGLKAGDTVLSKMSANIIDVSVVVPPLLPVCP